MSINQIQGGNNPNTTVHVAPDGRMLARTVNTAEQEHAAQNGDTYSIDSGVITLTDDLTTPVLYLRNTGEDRALNVSRLALTALASTGGVGPVLVSLIGAVTGGSILAAAEAPLKNFNVTSARTLAADARRGATGATVESANPEPVLRALFPAAPVFAVAEYNHIVVPRGGSIALTVTPPVGNTSMVVLVALNVFLSDSTGVSR